jgi:cysteine dioxygenase
METPLLLGTRTPLGTLIRALREVDFGAQARDHVALLLENSPIDEAELAPYISFDPHRYTRNLLYRDEAFELLALCWSLRSGSPVHDHGGKQCYMTVVSGSLQVEDFALRSGGRRQGYAHIAPAGTALLHARAIDVRTSTRDLHRVTAPHEPAVSLHIYASPLDRCMIFNAATRSCRTVFSRYDRVTPLSV